MPSYSTFLDIGLGYTDFPKQHAKHKSKGYIKAKKANEGDESKSDEEERKYDPSQTSKNKSDDEDGNNDSS